MVEAAIGTRAGGEAMIREWTMESWARAKEALERATALSGEERERFLCSLAEAEPDTAAGVRDLLEADEREGRLATLPLWRERTRAEEGTFAEGQLVSGRFEIRELIGRGGSGEVYRAYDQHRQKELALKVVTVSLARDACVVEMLRNELNTASQVSHRNVCRLFDITIPTGAGHAFITMELLKGETLAARLGRGTMTREEALPVMEEIAAGLDAAHEKGIVHRDLKPGNIMLVPKAEGGVYPVILDFGIARELEAGEVQRSLRVGEWWAGTPAYMAPEVLAGERAMMASDVHSLGVILFQVATGRLPFEGETAMSIASKRLNGPAPRARTISRRVDRRWEYAIARCLEREPQKRPESAREAVSLLRKKPPLAWAYRKLAPAGAAAAVFAALLFSLRPPPVSAEAQAELDTARVSLENRTESGFRMAIGELKKSTEAAPQWAEPWAELAYAYATASNWRFLDGKVAAKEARAAAERAITLNPRLAQAQAALGWTEALDYDEWVKAEDSFKRAIELDPRDGQARYWYAVHLRKKGKFREAERQLREAMQLTHRQNPNIWTELAFLYWTEGNLDAMENHMQAQLAAFPNFAFTRFLNARLLGLRGKYEEAQGELDFSKRLGIKAVTVLAEQASLDAARGRRAKAGEELSRLGSMQKAQEIDGLLVAGVYANLGMRDKAFEVLEAAYRRRDNTLLSAATSPSLKPLRDDARFAALLEKLHYTDQSSPDQSMQGRGLSSSSETGAEHQPSSKGTE